METSSSATGARRRSSISSRRRWLEGEESCLLPPPPALDDESSAGPSRRVRAYLKVQDGCSGACTYCRAVQLRGAARSKSVCAAVAEARRLVADGFPEIILTGVNLAEYDAPDGRLATLARQLLDTPGLARLRLASINVSGLSDDLLDVAKSDRRFCPHFHVPLQSGDDAVLREMRRPYTSAQYRRALENVRRRLPDATFGADVIVGFPGEDDAAFAATCRMIEDVGFANLHVFRFSSRLGHRGGPPPGEGARSRETRSCRPSHGSLARRSKGHS